MSEDGQNNQQGGNDKQVTGKSPEQVKSALLAQMKQAKQKNFQGELKKKLDAEDAAAKVVADAQKVLASKQEETQDFMAENAHLFQ